MRKQFKIVSALALVIFLIYCNQKNPSPEINTMLVSKHARPLNNIHFETTPARLKRGEYLANGLLRCFTCHSPSDTSKPGKPWLPEKKGGGAIYFHIDSTLIVAPNISPDPETGAGTWTDDMFVRAIREGVGHDGRALDYMPWWTFASISDEDLASVIVYIRTIPPVKNQLPHRHLSANAELELQNEERPEQAHVAEPDLSTKLSRGKYLVTIGECEGCHTAWYKRNPGVFGGGNMIHFSKKDSVCSPNLSPDPTGLGSWSDTIFTAVIRSGKYGTLNWVMPWIAFRNLNDEDLSDMLAALKSLPPVSHHILNNQKGSFCEVCDQYHGGGKLNKIVPIKTYPADSRFYKDYAGNFVDRFKDTTIITFKDKKLWIKIKGVDSELIPVSATEFQASGFMAPVSFAKDKNEISYHLVLHDLIPEISRKVL